MKMDMRELELIKELAEVKRKELLEANRLKADAMLRRMLAVVSVNDSDDDGITTSVGVNLYE